MTPPRDAADDGDPSGAAPFSVGAWVADPATNQLRRDGEVVRLEPKAMTVLVLLAQRAGQAMTREALMASAWPGVVVGDEALTQTIIKLRRALGDAPRAPAYIETIAKRGYRLIAPVGPPPPLTGSAARAHPPARPPAARRVTLMALAAGLVAVLVVATLLLRAPASRTGTASASADAGDALPRAELTLTVVPFEALGASGEHAYLARGITNDLVTELSRVPGLRLVTGSVPAGPLAVSRGSRYYVSGAVQRAGDTLRVTVHAIDGESGEPLWTERFERPYGDLFAVQDEIIGRVATLLPMKLADAARMRVARRHTRSLAAYDDFLQAQALFLTRQLAANEEARALYRKALAADPNFARAYAGIAMTHALDHVLDPSPASAAFLPRALELAETARLIDPDLAEVHWALGFVHTQSRRLDEAAASLAEAIRINPSFADAYALLAGIHTYRGEPGRSIALLRSAQRLEPDGGHLYAMILGRAYLFDGDVEQALINLQDAVARNPVNLETRLYLAAALVAQGSVAAAAWEAEEVRALAPAFSLSRWLDSYPLASAPHRQRLERWLAVVDF